jgi:hypothetical protein
MRTKYNVYYKDREGVTQRANSLSLNKSEAIRLVKELGQRFQDVWKVAAKEN